MAKIYHEIRDPIHVFIKLDNVFDVITNEVNIPSHYPSVGRFHVFEMELALFIVVFYGPRCYLIFRIVFN